MVSLWFLMLCVVWVDVLFVVIFVQELCTFFHGVGCFSLWVFFFLVFLIPWRTASIAVGCGILVLWPSGFKGDCPEVRHNLIIIVIYIELINN